MSSLACAHILEEIDSPLAAIDYYAGFAHEEHSFLLDSGRDPEKLGHYSFAGRKPFLVFQSKGDRIRILRQGSIEHRRGNPFEELRAALAPYRVDASLYRESPIPFLGGAVGYFGYELNYVMEKLPCRGADDLALPDCYFMFFDSVIVRDELEQKLYLSALGFDSDPAAAREKARQAFATMRAEMARVERGEASAGTPGTDDRRAASTGPADADLKIRSMFTQEEYMDVVRQAKEHIFAGDIFEVCTTHRLECDFAGNAFELYRELKRINPAPFASYLNLPEVKVVSSSPERFLRLKRDGWAESRPIKGTRPRGKDEAEDKAFHDDLFSSIKDRAENMMIVDLVRNDLGRVCDFHTVRVPELMLIERYATVFQMVSTIVGKLEPGRDLLDLVQACFPGGSMTGAPKIEAMSIIDALEPVKRGIYSGSIGYLDFAGNADLNIVIRTILVKNGKAYFQVGGAVVADSDPEGEYLETLHKASALIRSLRSVALGPDQADPGGDVRSLIG